MQIQIIPSAVFNSTITIALQLPCQNYFSVAVEKMLPVFNFIFVFTSFKRQHKKDY